MIRFLIDKQPFLSSLDQKWSRAFSQFWVIKFVSSYILFNYLYLGFNNCYHWTNWLEYPLLISCYFFSLFFGLIKRNFSSNKSSSDARFHFHSDDELIDELMPIIKYDKDNQTKYSSLFHMGFFSTIWICSFSNRIRNNSV